MQIQHYNKIIIYIFSALICSSSNAAYVYERNKSIELEWSTPSDLQAERTIFLKSYKYTYKDATFYGTDIKDRENLDTYLNDEFTSHFTQKPDSIRHMVRAIKDGQIVGFALFEQQENSAVLIRELCVDPDHWKKGIGKELLFSIFEKLPDTKKLIMVTMKINSTGGKFLRTHGFKGLFYPNEEWMDLMTYEWYRTKK